MCSPIFPFPAAGHIVGIILVLATSDVVLGDTAEHSARCLQRSHAGAGSGGNTGAAAERAMPVPDCYQAALLSHHVAPASRIWSRQCLPLHIHGVLCHLR